MKIFARLLSVAIPLLLVMACGIRLGNSVVEPTGAPARQSVSTGSIK